MDIKISLKIFLAMYFILSGSLLHSETAEIDSLLNNSKKAFSEKRTEEGLILLDKAAQLAETQKDANACLAVGLAYAGLPSELERKSFAIDILKKGSEFAKDKKDYSLLGKYAKELKDLGEKDTAIEIYDEIFLYAGELKDKDIFTALKTKYEELGDEERAGLCDKMIEALTIPPPPDWQPLGESVRGPKESPPEMVQQTQRQISDEEVQATMDYFIEKKKLEALKKKGPMPDEEPDEEPPIQY